MNPTMPSYKTLIGLFYSPAWEIDEEKTKSDGQNHAHHSWFHALAQILGERRKCLQKNGLCATVRLFTFFAFLC
jgi:hypothetical protein